MIDKDAERLVDEASFLLLRLTALRAKDLTDWQQDRLQAASSHLSSCIDALEEARDQ